MGAEPLFRAGLYRGTAALYDRFRHGYPAVLIDDLVSRARPTGRGRALDLACGTGQLAFALPDSYAEIWAVDQEPDMVAVVRDKIAARQRGRIRAVCSSAEELVCADGSFELVVIGNAFHRLPRERVAGRLIRWLQPGGQLALLWSTSPWDGDGGWKAALRGLIADWRGHLTAGDRIPPGWNEYRRLHSDDEILHAAGFRPAGRREVVVEKSWTTTELAGFLSATSFLSAPLFGDRTAEFERDLAERLTPFLDNAGLIDPISYACQLHTRPW